MHEMVVKNLNVGDSNFGVYAFVVLLYTGSATCFVALADHRSKTKLDHAYECLPAMEKHDFTATSHVLPYR